jgi:hypothetical protein
MIFLSIQLLSVFDGLAILSGLPEAHRALQAKALGFMNCLSTIYTLIPKFSDL